MIKITNLKKIYEKNEILKNINLEIAKGEICAIVGHSGAGKSTLLRCINGLEDYNDGSLKVFNKEIKALKEKELRELRAKVGMIFQHFALMDRKNVYENVAMPLIIHKKPKEFIDKKVKELLSLVGLSDKQNAYPSSLSGGQKQRVAIARALALEPKIILSDEATSALDPSTTNQILDLLKQINQELGISVVLVTHEMDAVKRIAHKACLLDNGEIISYGTISDLFLHPNKRMRKFLSEDEFLPENGTNLRLIFPKNVAQNSIISQMARSLDINFSIVWGKIEKLDDANIGSLIINIDPAHKDKIIDFVLKNGLFYEEA